MMAEKLEISEPDLRRIAPVTVMTRGEAGFALDHTVGKDEFDIPPRQAQPLSSIPPVPATRSEPEFILGLKQGLPWPIIVKAVGCPFRSLRHRTQGASAAQVLTRRIRSAIPGKLRFCARDRDAPRGRTTSACSPPIRFHLVESAGKPHSEHRERRLVLRTIDRVPCSSYNPQ